MNTSELITVYKQITIRRLSEEELPRFSYFVIQENYKHHKKNMLTQADNMISFKEEYLSILLEEKSHFKYSSIIVATDTLGNLIGSIRVMKWNDNPNPIAMTTLFENDLVNKESLINAYQHVWHVGRFAICKGCKEQMTLFRLLMVYAISPIFNYNNGVLLAEVDEKLLRIMRLLKINAFTLGEGVEYLGSMTIPVMITKEGLRLFLLENMNLVSPAQLKRVK